MADDCDDSSVKAFLTRNQKVLVVFNMILLLKMKADTKVVKVLASEAEGS